MSASADEFLRCLSASGLLPAGELQELIAVPVSGGRSSDPAALAGELIQSERLTPFQAARLLEGQSQGLVIGDYLVLDELPHAGASHWYRARHRSDGRSASLIALASAIDSDRANQLKTIPHHPALPSVQAVISDGGTNYLVLNEFEGEDLRSVVQQQGPLPVDLAVDCLLQVVDGLMQLEKVGLTCRMRAEEILLDSTGAVRLLGIAAPPAERVPESRIGVAKDGEPGEGADLQARRAADLQEIKAQLQDLLILLTKGSSDTPSVANFEQPTADEQNHQTKQLLQMILQRLRAGPHETGYFRIEQIAADLQACSSAASSLPAIEETPGPNALQPQADQAAEPSIERQHVQDAAASQPASSAEGGAAAADAQVPLPETAQVVSSIPAATSPRHADAPIAGERFASGEASPLANGRNEAHEPASRTAALVIWGTVGAAAALMGALALLQWVIR